VTIEDLIIDAKELLNLRPDGWIVNKLHDAVKLAEESGEVAECMTKSRKTIEDLGEELSDVMVVCAVIALRNGIDLTEACRKKQVKRVQKLVDRFHGGTYPL
jgi:phosphoribosyl-ATP pyrophosphohydrolase